jgi:serine/threonine protein kinase
VASSTPILTVTPERGSTAGPASLPGYGTELTGRFRYRLIKRLSKGAFGAVYFARCLDASAESRAIDAPPEAVAVKILGPTRRRDHLELLKRELSSLLALRHERIPQVYDWSLEGEFPFVAMAHFRAGDLRDVLGRGGTLAEPAVWRLLHDLLSALVAAHRASILHLDVKPANVLRDSAEGYVLTDFGVSQATRIQRGSVRCALGTPGYQAPEQREEAFELYDVRTDLYSVGATAWSMVTGIPLSERPRLVRDARSGATYGLPPVSQFRIYCSPALEDLIMSLLVIDRAARPGSAAEVLARVRGFLADPSGGSSLAAKRRNSLSAADVSALVNSLVDPLLSSICRERGFDGFFVAFEDGEPICIEDEQSYHAFLLLRGRVRVERGGCAVARIEREGAFLGEVSTLTGLARTASVYAEGPVHACMFNAAELEEFVTSHPAVGIRLLRSMAERLAPQDQRQSHE